MRTIRFVEDADERKRLIEAGNVAFEKMSSYEYMTYQAGDGVYLDNMKISNALIFPEMIINLHSSEESMTEKIIRLCIILPNDVVIRCEIEYNALKSIDYQYEIDSRICLSYALDSKEVNRLIFKMIQRMLPEIITKERVVLEKLGWYSYNGRHLYCIGNGFIGSSGNDVEVCCSDEVRCYRLEYKECPDNLRGQMITGLITSYINLYEGKSVILLLYLIVGLLRSVYHEAGLTIKFCAMIVGENQTYKTTIASYGTSIYNRITDVEDGIHNLTSSKIKLMQQLEIEKDKVCIIDDMNKSDLKSIERKQTGMVSDLIRMAANNIGRSTMNYDNSINAQVLFCGEYALSNESTNNRLVLIPFYKDEIDKEKLSEFEKKSEYLGLFVEDFISWAVQNYEIIIMKLKSYKDSFYSARKGVKQYQERLQYNYFVLGTAFNVLQMFFGDRNIIIASFNIHKIKGWLENAMQSQIEYLEMDGKQEVDYIKELYVALEDNYSEYVFKKAGINEWIGKICYDKKEDLMCIPGDVMSKMIEDRTGQGATAYTIANQFIEHGLLSIDNNKNGSRTKKVLRKRAYCIWYTDWQNYVKENYTSC